MIRILIADDQALVRAGFKMILDAEDDLAARPFIDGPGRHPLPSPASFASTTSPSVATASPGRTTKTSPTASCSIGMRVSLRPPEASSRSTATSLAPSSIRARRAAPDWRLARDSSQRPAMMKVVTPAAASR